MTLQRIAGVCFSIVITSAVAAGQQRAETADQPPLAPANRTIERAYPSGGLPPSRVTQTRTASGGREIVTETVAIQGINGKTEPVAEFTIERVQSSPNRTRSTQDLVGVGAERQRILLERTESVHEVSSNGNSRTVATTWVPDPNGRLGLQARQVEETTSSAPGIRESRTTRLVPGINEPLSESERSESTERQINASLVRQSSTQLVRDLNGRWQSTETRTLDSRQMGLAERVEEETVLRPDLNGKLMPSERTITRRSRTSGREDVVSETYTPEVEGFVRPDPRFSLSRRVRTSTTVGGDGGSHTVEQVEERSLVAPADPMRLVRRAEITVRKTGPNRWTTERRVFEMDVNGRLVPTITEVEDSTGR